MTISNFPIICQWKLDVATATRLLISLEQKTIYVEANVINIMLGISSHTVSENTF